MATRTLYIIKCDQEPCQTETYSDDSMETILLEAHLAGWQVNRGNWGIDDLCPTHRQRKEVAAWV